MAVPLMSRSKEGGGFSVSLVVIFKHFLGRSQPKYRLPVQAMFRTTFGYLLYWQFVSASNSKAGLYEHE